MGRDWRPGWCRFVLPALEIGLIVALVLVNGFLAASELAIVSSRKTRLQQRAGNGSRGARIALELAADPNRFLSTVQVGITLVGILAGAFAGATVAGSVGSRFESWGLSPRAADTLSVAVVVLGVTYLSLIIGELVPKRVALANPEALATRVALPMKLLSTAGAPAILVLSASTNAVLRVLRVKQTSSDAVTEEELHLLLAQSAESGVIESAEQEIAAAALRLGDLAVGDVMTPRPQVVWLDLADPPGELWEQVMDRPHDHFPVCEGDPENVVGVVSAKDLLSLRTKEQGDDLRPAVRAAIYLPESLQLLTALERFREGRAELAIVVDEFGSAAGIITLFDIIERIVGDLPELDEEGMVVQRADGSWLVDGRLGVDDLRRLLTASELPGEGEYQTLAGFVLWQMGRVPLAGERFTWERHSFEVMDMDGRRVDRVLITAEPAETG